jgi:cardiolipin synthase
MTKENIFSIPNIITLTRIFSIPFIVILFYIHTSSSLLFCLILFIVVGLTDFLDGYLARKLKQISTFGRFLDPIADKLLVSVLYIVLVGDSLISGIHVIGVCLIISREFIITGLREILAEKGIIINSSRLAKWKTTVQCVNIGFYISKAFVGFFWVPFTCTIQLWLTTFITIYSGIQYLVPGLQKLLF